MTRITTLWQVLIGLSLTGSSLAAGLAQQPLSTTPTDNPQAPKAPEVRRIGGDAEVQAKWDAAARVWRSGGSKIETALPQGYPPPTPPGAIELKQYPAVRRAEIDGGGRNTGTGFMQLFRHIERNNIAMTAPVEMDYCLESPSGPPTGRWTMSFLYRTPDLHPTGSDTVDPRVRIRDVDETLVISLGGRGSYEPSRIMRDVDSLTDWIDSHPEWEIDGDPRALLYNGPNLRPWMNWLEVQIPVRRSQATEEATTEDLTGD